MADWALFLDRDGVINTKPPEHQHIERLEQFVLIPSVPTALTILRLHFHGIFIVSNQRGVEETALKQIDYYMVEQLARRGASVNDIIYAIATDEMRKPDVGMAYQIKKQHSWIDFKKSVMVGDSMTDMQFGRKLGMKNVWISSHAPVGDEIPLVDLVMKDLYTFAMFHDACMADQQTMDWRYEI